MKAQRGSSHRLLFRIRKSQWGACGNHAVICGFMSRQELLDSNTLSGPPVIIPTLQHVLIFSSSCLNDCPSILSVQILFILQSTAHIQPYDFLSHHWWFWNQFQWVEVGEFPTPPSNSRTLAGCPTTQSWHYLPRDKSLMPQVKAQSHKTVPSFRHQSQVQTVTCSSDQPALTWGFQLLPAWVQ